MTLKGWQMAKGWLRSTGIVPPTSIIHSESCDLFDFAHSLRDGVLLCHVANRLADGAVKDVNLATHMSQFLCMKNIKGFLKACNTIFEISHEDLFSATDLYGVSDFQKVIHTLSLLSKTRQALSLHVEAFSPQDHQNDDHEETYATLTHVLSGKTDYHTAETENYYDIVSIQESEIYGDIVECRLKVKGTRETQHPVDKRSHVVNEILQTEENYCNALQVMIECFIAPLKSLLKPEEKTKIFINTEKLYQFHREFLRLLRPAGRTIDISSFTTCKMRFLEYGHYCARVREAQEYVTEKSKVSAFSTKVEECKKMSGRKFPLQELLIVPFQRILKYPLLLKELRKRTPVGHKDRKQIDKALLAMEDVGKYVNMYKMDDDEKQNLIAISNSVHDDFGNVHMRIHEFGRRVQDGELNVKFSNNDKKKRFAFLFDKTLLLCKTRGDTYVVKENILLKMFKLEKEIPNNIKGIRPQLAWALEAREPDGATEANNCIIIAKSPQEKEKWVNDIESRINAVSLVNVKVPDRHSFELTTFTTGKSCAVCELLLCGQISQGYNCEHCQKAVHYDCIEKCPVCVTKKLTPGTSYEGHDIRSIKPADTPLLQEVKYQIGQYPWFGGELKRDEANSMLMSQGDGSFLVRYNALKQQFALSVKYRSNVKHIVIEIKGGTYCLTEAKRFTSIMSMIEYYKRNSLEVSFPSLPTKLMETVSNGNSEPQQWVQALFNFEAENEDELSFVTGDMILVIQSNEKWWYGECNGKTGYFPSSFVNKYGR